MTYWAHLTRISWNRKTGPMPVATTPRDYCPTTCPLVRKCYPEAGKLKLHWNRVTGRIRGVPWGRFLKQIRSLPQKIPWRFGEAGDLPGDGNRIDWKALIGLARANGNRLGFGYTHYPPSKQNVAAIREALKRGLTINMSANSPGEADQLASLGVPVVTLLPSDTTENQMTPGGRPIVICAYDRDPRITCSRCLWCAKSDRKFIVGFPGRGTFRKHIDRVVTEREGWKRDKAGGKQTGVQSFQEVPDVPKQSVDRCVTDGVVGRPADQKAVGADR